MKTTQDIDDALKDMFADVLREALEAELDIELGYLRNGSIPDRSRNWRNGHTEKTVRSNHGESALSAPRGRQSEFEPIIIKKHYRKCPALKSKTGVGRASEDKPVFLRIGYSTCHWCHVRKRYINISILIKW